MLLFASLGANDTNISNIFMLVNNFFYFFQKKLKIFEKPIFDMPYLLKAH